MESFSAKESNTAHHKNMVIYIINLHSLMIDKDQLPKSVHIFQIQWFVILFAADLAHRNYPDLLRFNRVELCYY